MEKNTKKIITIFLTIFEGIESKNILRTSILPTLLSLPNSRLVLLVKNQERSDYLMREFNDPRLAYECVDLLQARGLDKFLARLKFILLRTETTDFRRRMMRQLKQQGKVAYFAGVVLNWFIARSLIRRVVRFIDFTCIRNFAYDSLFDAYHPDLVVMANLFDEQEIHLLRGAKKRGISTVGFINSWDRLTARCIIRLLPDTFIVFNDFLKNDLVKFHDADPSRIFVSGIPQYDGYITDPPSRREAFFSSIGEHARNHLIIYSPLGGGFQDLDWSMIDLLYELRQKGRFGDHAVLRVRFPPNDYFDYEEINKRPFLRYDYPGVRFSKKRGVDWDMSPRELSHLTDTLRHMSLLICYGSSMSVDAALLDKPVININFEPVTCKSTDLSAVKFYGMTHYKKALETGGIRLVNSERELIKWVTAYLENPSLDHDGRARLAREQCQFLDGRSGERIGKFILKQL